MTVKLYFFARASQPLISLEPEPPFPCAAIKSGRAAIPSGGQTAISDARVSPPPLEKSTINTPLSCRTWLGADWRVEANWRNKIKKTPPHAFSQALFILMDKLLKALLQLKLDQKPWDGIHRGSETANSGP